MSKSNIFITTFFISLFSFTCFAQDKLNNYKYVSIPKKLKIQKKENEYQINTLLKQYLNNKDFVTFIQGDSITNNIKPCDILNLNADKSGFLTTKIILTFSDCYGNNIYTTQTGKSRIKEFKDAYYEALRGTLKDPNIKEHKFTGKIKRNIVTTKNKATTNKTSFILELKGTKYYFTETDIKNNLIVSTNQKPIGTLKKKANSNLYLLDTKKLKGTGTFDDFGNFSLTRINPVNKATITDIMARIN